MNLKANQFFLLENLIPQQRGVFSIKDLKNLFLASSTAEVNQKLNPYLKEKILQRFSRGYYVAKEFDLSWLSSRICPRSAISFGSVLAKEQLIGSIPQKTIYAVKMGKSRIYRSSLGQIVHLGFTPGMNHLWFGYEKIQNGIRYANPEKAVLDTLYFYQSGQRFSFNIYSNINYQRLDLKKMNQYLANYKNPKFRKFVEGVIDAKHSIR